MLKYILLKNNLIDHLTQGLNELRKARQLCTGENRRFEQQIFAASVFESAFHMFSCNILG